MDLQGNYRVCKDFCWEIIGFSRELWGRKRIYGDIIGKILGIYHPAIKHSK